MFAKPSDLMKTAVPVAVAALPLLCGLLDSLVGAILEFDSGSWVLTIAWEV